MGDNISKAELVKRDETIQDLTTKYNKELKLRKETEQLKEQTELQLVSGIISKPWTFLTHPFNLYRKTHKK